MTRKTRTSFDEKMKEFNDFWDAVYTKYPKDKYRLEYRFDTEENRAKGWKPVILEDK